jgi:hypothetical protein
MKITIFTFLLSFIYSSVFAHDTTAYQSKWQVKPQIGIYRPITKLLKGSFSDNFIMYEDETSYLQFISVSYFFSKHFGIEVNFNGANSNKIDERTENVKQIFISEYSNNYYVTPGVNALDGGSNLLGGDVERGFIGFIYRLEKNKFHFYPKATFGLTSFYTSFAGAGLKEKNSNTVLDVNYFSIRRPNDLFTFGLSSSFGYKFHDRVFFNIDISSYYFKSDFTIYKTIKDGFKNIIESESYRYNSDVFNYSIGAGLTFVLGKKRLQKNTH